MLRQQRDRALGTGGGKRGRPCDPRYNPRYPRYICNPRYICMWYSEQPAYQLDGLVIGAIAERESHLFVCRAWPGPVCGSCWSASCVCGYVFDAVADAHARWPNGRLRCYRLRRVSAIGRAVEQAAPASAPGGPLADARERLRSPHPRTHVVVGVGPGPAW